MGLVSAFVFVGYLLSHHKSSYYSPYHLLLSSGFTLQHAAALTPASPRRQRTAWRLPVSVRLREDGVRLHPHPQHRRSSESQTHRRLSSTGGGQHWESPIIPQSKSPCLFLFTGGCSQMPGARRPVPVPAAASGRARLGSAARSDEASASVNGAAAFHQAAPAAASDGGGPTSTGITGAYFNNCGAKHDYSGGWKQSDIVKSGEMRK